MSISTVNEDPRGNCPVWESEDGEFFSVGMKEKVLRERFGDGDGILPSVPRRLRPRGDS
ncbi:hypothetical protein A2U01_0053898, partial [Trifolium medium]|nr:hypothetical protein [Trifolium medium]